MTELKVLTSRGNLEARPFSDGVNSGIEVYCDGILVNRVEDSSLGLRAITYGDFKDDEFTDIAVIKEPELLQNHLYGVPVSYAVSGVVYVEASSKQELIELLDDKDFLQGLELPDKPDYIEDSYEVDSDLIVDLENDTFEKLGEVELWTSENDYVTVDKVRFAGCDSIFMVTNAKKEKSFYQTHYECSVALDGMGYSTFSNGGDYVLLPYVHVDQEGDDQEAMFVVYYNNLLGALISMGQGGRIDDLSFSSEEVWEMINVVTKRDEGKNICRQVILK